MAIAIKRPVVVSRDPLVVLPPRVAVRRRGWLIRRGLLVADLAGLTLAFGLAALLFPAVGQGHFASPAELAAFVISLPLWVVFAKLQKLYDHDEERTNYSTSDDLVGVFHLVTAGTWSLYVVAKILSIADPGLLRLVFFWGAAIGLITLLRASARGLCRRHGSYVQKTVIVGAGDVGQLVAKKLLHHPEYGLDLVGFVDSEPREQSPELDGLTILGSVDDLPRLVGELGIVRVIIAFSRDSHEGLLVLVRQLADLDVQVDIVPRLFDVVGPGVDMHSVEGLALVGLRPFQLARSSLILKRGFDLIFATGTLVLLAPLLVVIAVRVKLGSKGPVFFRQVRMGAGSNTFRMWKFRTMVVGADDHKAEIAHLSLHAQNGGDPRMFKVANDPRVTHAGRLLRRTSLDELPQLLNVLKGQMSLVGPRPLILGEDRWVRNWARKRLDLKPGMTGLWQVLGRSDIPFDEMVKLDYMYVTDWSLLGDLKLALRTIPALVRARHAY